MLVGGPGLWRLMESESLGRMREQLIARIVVEPLSDAEARHFAAWRCRERLERFGPDVTDAAMVEALVRYGLGLPARIDALVDRVALLAPSRGGADAALVAEAAAMLAGGPVSDAPIITRPEPAAPDPRPHSPATAAPALRRRWRPALLAGLLAAAAVAGWLGFGRFGVPWLPWATKTAMIARRASATTHAVPSASVASTPQAAPPAAVATAAPNPAAPAPGAAPAVGVASTPPAAPSAAATAAGPNRATLAPGTTPSASAAPTPPAAPPPAVATAGPNPAAPAPGTAPSVNVAPTPATPPGAIATAGPTPPAAPAAPEASTDASTNPSRGAASLAGLRKDFDAFLARAGTDTAVLTDAQKRALFAQYLAWRTRQAATAPVAADPSPAAP